MSHSTHAPLPSVPEIDLTTQIDLPVYTSGYAFHVNIAGKIKPRTIVRLVSYNVGINIGERYIDDLVSALCLGQSARFLIGYNPHHDQNFAINFALSKFAKTHKNLTIRRQEKQHGKLILLEHDKRDGSKVVLEGWTGSLNLISPTLADIMVKLSVPQCHILRSHFDEQWAISKPFVPPIRLVHGMNKTPKP